MPLEFELDKSFAENFAEFKKHLESLDPECARIFLDNQGTLLGDGNPGKARQNRIAFNESVLEQLKALPPKTGSS